MASTPPTSPAGLAVLRRLDYVPVDFTARTVSLDVSLRPGATTVAVTTTFERLYTPAVGETAPRAVVLHRGDAAVQALVSIELNGAPLSYALTDKTLTFTPPGVDGFTLRVVTTVDAEANTSLEGLYKSGSAYCTQCEAEGFRNITFFQDRPDVMATYTVRLEADKATCPVLLSNGNLVGAGDLPDGRHWTQWVDPFPKPSYLFALVAGDLALHEDVFTTVSGKRVALRIYTEHRDAGRTWWAMEALKKSFAWDETAFGLEYDLELFNIVAVSDFNMGAMENKSLNVFNSRLVLASKETASDVDFNRIEGVIAHEYFHNWTGNRVTCRNWFQLTLKEGLTVYRDQEFTADLNSRPVKRIEDVSRLRQAQFSEDAGPLAHAIRPDEVSKNDNLYTSTVYEKGAEVIRLYAAVLGTAGFRRGMDLYFQRHDGQAVTCDEFWSAMHDANADAEGAADLAALKVWYSQAGTPELTVTPAYDAGAQRLTLHCAQRTPPTAGQPHKLPALIPIAVGLVGADGRDVPLQLEGAAAAPAGAAAATTTVLRLTQASQSWTFTGVPAGCVPSVLRGFSAPVRLTVVGQTPGDLRHLLAHDSDAFNRFEAGQVLGRAALVALYDVASAAVAAAVAPGARSAAVRACAHAALGASGPSCASVADLAAAFGALLDDASLDGAFVARAISLPTGGELVDALAADAAHGTADPVVVYHTRAWAVARLARALAPQLRAAVARCDAAIRVAEAASGGYSPDFASVARRTLRNRALGYLAVLATPLEQGDGDAAAAGAGILADLAARHAAASNMTDAVSTLVCLADAQPEHPALGAFHDRWAGEPLVLLKWLSIQACAGHDEGATERVRALMGHAAFSIKNPNACYSLLGAYAGGALAFHAADGSGYAFLGEVVRTLDAINPTVASRIVSAFSKYRSLDAHRQGLIRSQLQALADGGKLSDNVGELVARSLAA